MIPLNALALKYPPIITKSLNAHAAHGPEGASLERDVVARGTPAHRHLDAIHAVVSAAAWSRVAGDRAAAEGDAVLRADD